MNRRFVVLLFVFALFACQRAESQSPLSEINLASGFSIVNDSISINVNGRMTHALEHQNKYYVLFEQGGMQYGGSGKRWLYVLSNNQVEKVIDCPEIESQKLDFYVQNDRIILKCQGESQDYFFDNQNLKWVPIASATDLVFSDSDYAVYALNFGRNEGKTWFRDKKTANEFVLEFAAPLVNKIGTAYYLTNPHRVLRIPNPKALIKCDNDIAYESTLKSANNFYLEDQSKGYEVIYNDENLAEIDFLNRPSIVTSFVANQELLQLYQLGNAVYLARIVDNKMQLIDKVFEGIDFFNWPYSYRCININGANQLLQFDTKNVRVSGLASIKGNQINVTYLVNDFELSPKSIGKAESNEIFEKRLQILLRDFTQLTLTEIAAQEKKWKTFDITPNHTIGIGESWNPNQYVIDTNLSYLIVEDATITNSVLYFATQASDLVRAVTMEWEQSPNFELEFIHEKSTNEAFSAKFKELVLILTKELGNPNSTTKKKKKTSFAWTKQDKANLEITHFSAPHYNAIRLVIYERK